MSLTVALSASIRHGMNAGGAAWFYLNWALSLRALGCRVYWLEALDGRRHGSELARYVCGVERDLARFGLADSLAFCAWEGDPVISELNIKQPSFDVVADESDLFLNVGYFVNPGVVGAFRRSAFIDGDPGMCQIWMSSGQLAVPPHHAYFSIGESAGTARASFPDCGVLWNYTPLPVYLPCWPAAPAMQAAPYTTVSNWWGGRPDWILYDGTYHDNSKRAAFLEYVDLPRRAGVPLELVLTLTQSVVDMAERRQLEDHGWRVRTLEEVDWTPEAYAEYLRGSRGELSCAKPFYVRLKTAFIPDRTLQYLASGRPAVIQHTGPSGFLPDGEGLFRFRTMSEAVAAFKRIESDYLHQCKLARALAEEYFDGIRVVRRVLERALQ